jgi:hypothetical protein
MSQLSRSERVYDLRMRPKDIGVALVTALCLLGGLLLMLSTTTRTATFQDEATPLQLQYPANWTSVDSLQAATLRVVDPTTPGGLRTSLTVEERELDPAAPPTLQTLLDRRVEERQQLMGYHFLSDAEAEVDGARALVSEYAYVVQPIDEARRASLPVVAHAREYIVVAGDHSYYITMAAPEAQFATASRQFDRIIRSVTVQP